MLTLPRWLAKDCKTIEHVAPQNPPENHTWSSNIYQEDFVHRVGNLILLPLEVNRFADNKGWGVKYLHYCHVGQREEAKLIELKDKAEAKGIVLSKKATRALSNMDYSCAVEPVLSLDEEGVWDSQFIARRTEQIKSVAWDTLFAWLQ